MKSSGELSQSVSATRADLLRVTLGTPALTLMRAHIDALYEHAKEQAASAPANEAEAWRAKCECLRDLYKSLEVVEQPTRPVYSGGYT